MSTRAHYTTCLTILHKPKETHMTSHASILDMQALSAPGPRGCLVHNLH